MKHYASLIAALAAAGIATGAYAAGDVAAGKQKAASCAGCHGATGKGNGATPALAGKAPGEIAKALGEYKSGARSNAVMKSLSANLSAQDIQNLAAYYGSLK